MIYLLLYYGVFVYGYTFMNLMVKIISNEEYAKRVDEYKILDKEKVTFVSFGEVKSLKKRLITNIIVVFKAWLFKSFLLLYSKGEIND